VAPFTGISDPLGSSRISAHLLLLLQGLLQVDFLTPSACAVGGRPQNYRGERFLLLFQNLHRYFLYLALVFCVILSYDVILSFSFKDGVGVGVGTVV
jgi:hypothetical protein